MAATAQDTPLFSPELIPTDVVKALPEGYSIRPLEPRDYHLGFLTTLSVLTTIGDISEASFLERFQYLHSTAAGTYYLIVVLDGRGEVVGTGALVVERKFIHGLGLVGHIEDIAVNKDQQGKKLGLRIIQALDAVGEKVGCYKVWISVHWDHAFGRLELRLTAYFRRYSTAQRRTKGFTSSVDTNVQAWRWRTTTREKADVFFVYYESMLTDALFATEKRAPYDLALLSLL